MLKFLSSSLLWTLNPEPWSSSIQIGNSLANLPNFGDEGWLSLLKKEQISRLEVRVLRSRVREGNHVGIV